MHAHLTSLFLALIIVIGAAGQANGAPLFRDDFEIDGMPDPSKWVINHPGECWWVMGRTHFPCPEVGWTPGNFPVVEDGHLLIKHHLYNPYHLGTPKWTFLGGEVHTVMEFDPNEAYRFEARVRLNPGDSPYVPHPDGLVTSFFLYGYDGSKSDEIDHEFVSKWINDDVTWPNGAPVLTNTWNESFQKPIVVAPEGLDLTQWNTFRIYWDPGERVEWTWLDPLNGETSLRTETDVSFIPDEPMALYFNFWAPCYTGWGHGCGPWDDAADSELQPVDFLAENEISAFEIDYVSVVRNPPPVPALRGWGIVLLAGLLLGVPLCLSQRLPHVNA